MEIDFEGSESFLENHFPNLVELLSSVAIPEGADEIDDLESEEELLETSEDSPKSKLQMSTSTIANRLNASSGKDLVLAACTHLAFIKGHENYERKNILAEMKTASSYYKKNYSKNLTTILQRLVKASALNELSEKNTRLRLPSPRS